MKTRKAFALLLALVLCVSLLPMGVLAASPEETTLISVESKTKGIEAQYDAKVKTLTLTGERVSRNGYSDSYVELALTMSDNRSVANEFITIRYAPPRSYTRLLLTRNPSSTRPASTLRTRSTPRT